MILEINEEQRMILRDLLEEEIRYLKEDAIPSALDIDKESLYEALSLNKSMLTAFSLSLENYGLKDRRSTLTFYIL